MPAEWLEWPPEHGSRYFGRLLARAASRYSWARAASRTVPEASGSGGVRVYNSVKRPLLFWWGPPTAGPCAEPDPSGSGGARGVGRILPGSSR